MKGNVKIKIVFVILVILTMGIITTFCYATENPINNIINTNNTIENVTPPTTNTTINNNTVENVTTPATPDTDINPEVEKPEDEETEIKLNRKVKFIGKTYRLSTGKKLFFLNPVKAEYTEDKPGEGIINIILKEKPYGIHIMGKGWIAESQILSSTRYIQITFETEGEKIKSTLKIDGEYIKVDSDNTGVITFEDGELTAVENGKTNVSFTTKEGEEINVVAVVNEGTITLNVPDKSVSSDMNIDTTVVEKVKINSDVSSVVSIEDGTIKITNESNEIINVNDEEIAKIETTADIEAKKTEDGIDVETKGGQTLTLLQRIAIALNEVLTTKINKDGISDPTVDVKGNVLDNEIINVEDKTIPIFSTLKTLLTKLISFIP